MGIYDREYYQDDQPRGIQLGGEMTMTTKIVIVNVVIWIIDDIFLNNGLLNSFSLKADLFKHPQHFYQLITAGFLHAQEVQHVLFNMLLLWLFGRDVEKIYGKREYLITYLTIIVMANLTWIASTQLIEKPDIVPHVVGASGGVVGIFLLFVFHYPKRTLLLWFVIPAPAWLLGLIIIAMDVFGLIASTQGQAAKVAFSAHLGGALFGFIYYKTRWNFGRLIPSGMFKSFGRPRLKIVDPDQYEQEMEDQIDVILKKISDQGMESLTNKEKKALEAHSRRIQQKRR